MKKKIIYIANGILIILAILCGYLIYYMHSQGMYSSSGYYKSKALRRAFEEHRYSIQYRLDTLYSNSNDLDKFISNLNLDDILSKETNIRIRFTSNNSEVLKTNVDSKEKIHYMFGYSWPVTYGNTEENAKSVYIELYLLEPISANDEFYDLYKEYAFIKKLNKPVIVIEILFIIVIIVLFMTGIRKKNSKFPGDIGIFLWLLSILISGFFIHEILKSNSLIVRVILSIIIGLMQYVSLTKLFSLILGQIRAKSFVKNMVIAKINQSVKYVTAIIIPVICQAIISYFLFHSHKNQKEMLGWIQAILLILEIILILTWIGRSNIRLNKAVEQQIKSEKLKTELITNVSHDIKTPITSIINYVDLIKKEDIADEKLSEYIEVIDRQSLRLKKLITDVIEASKATTGNTRLNIIALDIWEMLNQAVGEYEELLQKNHLEVVINTGDDCENGIIMADGDQLWRIFDNVLSNICKYSAEDSRVYIDAVQTEQNYILIFKNISRDRLNITEDELFERFVRGDLSRHMEGSGLGLTIAKSLMELMGGTMSIEIEGDMFRAKLLFHKNAK